MLLNAHDANTGEEGDDEVEKIGWIEQLVLYIHSDHVQNSLCMRILTKLHRVRALVADVSKPPSECRNYPMGNLSVYSNMGLRWGSGTRGGCQSLRGSDQYLPDAS